MNKNKRNINWLCIKAENYGITVLKIQEVTRLEVNYFQEENSTMSSFPSLAPSFPPNY